MNIKLFYFLLFFLFLFVEIGHSQGKGNPADLPKDTLSVEWWNNLDDEWKRYFTDSAGVTIPVDTADFRKINEKRIINLHGYVIESLDPLKVLSNITFLNCSGAFITSLEPLAKMQELRTLICDSIPTLHSIKPLYVINSLVSVSITHTPIPSDEIKKLKSINLGIEIIVK